MRRILLLAISLALVIIAVFVVGCDIMTPPASPKVEPGQGIVFSQQNTGIWVTGEGKVTVVPDVATLSLGVEAQAATVAQAQSEASSAMGAVVRELDSHGVDKKDIKTQHFTIYPVRKWVKERDSDKTKIIPTQRGRTGICIEYSVTIAMLINISITLFKK